MSFDTKRKEKFERGAKEHTDQGWEKLTKDVILSEAMDECLDLYNYLTHEKLQKLSPEIQKELKRLAIDARCTWSFIKAIKNSL